MRNLALLLVSTCAAFGLRAEFPEQPYPTGEDVIYKFAVTPHSGYEIIIEGVYQTPWGLVIVEDVNDFGAGFAVISNKIGARKVRAPAIAIHSRMSSEQASVTRMAIDKILDPRPGEPQPEYDFSLDDGWVDSEVFGWCWINDYPWVWHPQHGWLLVEQVFEPLFVSLMNTNAPLGVWEQIATRQPFGYEWVDDGWGIVLHDTFRFWSSSNGWLRTGRFLYPWAWSETAQALIWWQPNAVQSLGPDWTSLYGGGHDFNWSE